MSNAWSVTSFFSRTFYFPRTFSCLAISGAIPSRFHRQR